MPTKLCATACLVACVGIYSVGAASTEGQRVFSAQEIREIVHDYILAHPDVLIEALQLAKQHREEQTTAAALEVVKANKSQLFESPTSPALGNSKGDVTIVEFFDYRCPYCRQADPLLRKLTVDDPQLRIVQKQLPILGPTSVIAARAALAANRQNKYSLLHDALMAKNPNYDEEGILKLAEGLGLDPARLKADMTSSEVSAELLNTARLAKQLGLTGTPAFLVGSELIPGATDLATLKSAVSDARDASRSLRAQ
jgi:protein-disulfide isomerase